MAIGYYPGCSLEGTAEEFNLSIVKVAEALGIELQEIDDWNCCGASAAHQTSHALGLALPARTLALAAEQGLESIFAPCAACSNRLICSQDEIQSDRAVKEEMERVIEKPLPDRPISIINCIELFLPRLEDLYQAASAPQTGKKAACYYGCLLLRPKAVVSFDDNEQPETMEKVVAATGAAWVDWGFRNECCGAAFAMSNTPAVARLVNKILKNARDEGADFMVTACPLCHANLDMRQNPAQVGGAMPILYLSQLVGLSLGMSPESLGLDKHITPVDAILGAGAAS